MKIAIVLAGMLLATGVARAQDNAQPQGQTQPRVVLPSSFFVQGFRDIDVPRTVTASGVDQVEKTKGQRGAEEKARRNAPIPPVVLDY